MIESRCWCTFRALCDPKDPSFDRSATTLNPPPFSLYPMHCLGEEASSCLLHRGGLLLVSRSFDRIRSRALGSPTQIKLSLPDLPPCLCFPALEVSLLAPSIIFTDSVKHASFDSRARSERPSSVIARQSRDSFCIDPLIV